MTMTIKISEKLWLNSPQKTEQISGASFCRIMAQFFHFLFNRRTHNALSEISKGVQDLVFEALLRSTWPSATQCTEPQIGQGWCSFGEGLIGLSSSFPIFLLLLLRISFFS